MGNPKPTCQSRAKAPVLWPLSEQPESEWVVRGRRRDGRYVAPS